MNMIKYLSFSAVVLLLLLVACDHTGERIGQLESVEVQDSIYGYVEKYTRLPEDFAKQGRYEKFDAKGTLMEIANYERDTLHGPRVVFFENGDTQIVEHYKMGLFDGGYQVFHENGQLQLEGSYTANEMTGEWRGYYDNGQLFEIVQFSNNEENGPFVEYHRNGKLKAEGNYLGGDNEHGELKLYSEDGELIRRMNCEQGVCRTQWKKEGLEEES